MSVCWTAVAAGGALRAAHQYLCTWQPAVWSQADRRSPRRQVTAAISTSAGRHRHPAGQWSAACHWSV